MDRGDRQEDVFVDDVDRQDLLKTMQKANRIISEELSSRGWQESDLTTRRRTNRGKLAIAARLRNEPILPIKWIAARMHIGTPKGAKTVLHQLAQGQRRRQPAPPNDTNSSNSNPQFHPFQEPSSTKKSRFDLSRFQMPHCDIRKPSVGPDALGRYANAPRQDLDRSGDKHGSVFAPFLN
jgi:hypothetical protein